MKKSVLILPLITMVVLFTACGGVGEKKAESLDASQFKPVNALDLYQVSVPKYMKSATGLNPDASMQFQNAVKETYLAVIEEDKADFVDVFKELGQYDENLSVAGNYRKTQIEYFTESISVSNKSEPKVMTINNLSAEQLEFSARVPEVSSEIYYLMTFIEGDENIYMVMEWTLEENKSKYKETFEEIAKSFKEI